MTYAATYRTPAGRLPPRRPPGPKAAREPHLAHFVILSILLHALAIALFGAPSGGNPEGRAMWGALRVVLAAPFQDPGPALKLDRGLGSELPGSSIAPRQAVVPSAPSTLPPPSNSSALPVPAPPVAPAAPPPPVELNVTRKIDRPATPEAPKRAPPAESTKPAEVQADPAPTPAPFVTPPLIERVVAPELKNELLPALQLPPREPEVISPPAPPVRSQYLPLVPPSPIEAPVLPAPVPAAPAPPEVRPASPRAERSPADSPAIAAPLATPAPPSVPEAAPTPPVERAPFPSPAVPVPRVERVVPEAAQPAPTERTPPRDMPATPAPPPTIERAPARPLEALPTEPAKREPRSSPFSTPAPESDPFGPRRESPFSSKDAKPSPGLDLDSTRRRARELAREGSGQSALFAMPVPPKPEYKSKEELALEKARKPDCRTAHKDLGLLAIVPLVANEFGEGNCRW